MHLSRKFGGFSAMTAHQTPMIFDTSDGQELRINTINTWLKKKFGHKIVKLSLDGGFTCPNRDGSKEAVFSVPQAARGIWPPALEISSATSTLR